MRPWGAPKPPKSRPSRAVGLRKACGCLQAAGAQSFARDSDYFRTRRVSQLQVRETSASGVVRGTEPHRVTLTLHRGDLDCACTCPYAAEGFFCKHAVAPGLAWAEQVARPSHDEPPADSLPELERALDLVAVLQAREADGLRTDVQLRVDLSAAERRRYERLRRAVVAELRGGEGALREEQRRFQVLAALTRLRQLACHVGLVDPAWNEGSSKLTRLLEPVGELKRELIGAVLEGAGAAGKLSADELMSLIRSSGGPGDAAS